jgi:hypothetical protein
MSPSEVESKHSAAWKAFLSSSEGTALVWWLEQQTTARNASKIADINERLHGAVAHFNAIIGEENLLRLIRSLTDEKTVPFNPPDTFEEPEQT